MPEEENEPVEDIPEFEGLPLKKKKKKKKPLNLEDLEKALTSSTNPQDADPAAGEPSSSAKDGEANDGAGEANENDNMEDLNFDFAKKKKKKKKTITFDERNDNLYDENATGNQDDGSGQRVTDDGRLEGSNWVGTDRDYTYDELIEHVFSIIRANNPELNAGEKKRFVLKPPTVLRVGTKKTSFANFLEICKLVHRQPKHMQAFLLAELGTSGSVDANNQLIIKGRFQQTQIENVLRRYIKEYVACQTCRSPNTILQKETRLFFLQCEKCGSRRSVSSIKSGFQAVTSKRAAIRAKTN
jgi:translation initiation factor 2 subunit 2